MSSRSGRGLRALRGTGAAGVATLVATMSHAAANGHLPSAWNVVIALTLATPTCVLLTGRAMSWWRLSAAVVISQALFHLLLSIDFAGRDTAVLMSTGVAHLHGAGLADSAASASAMATGHGAVTTPGMWVAHAFAAAVTVIALGRGERAVRMLLQLLRHPFRALVPFGGLPVPGLPLLEVGEPRFAARLVVLSVMRRRGPPVSRPSLAF